MPRFFGGDMPASEAERQLIALAHEGDIAGAKALFTQGVRANARQDSDGNRALHEAVGEGHWELARLLLRQGADANAPGMNGAYPLGIAIRRGHPLLVDLLVRNGALLEQRDTLGNTPLATAFLMDREDIARQLINAGARFDIRTGEKRCIAELAAGHASEELVQYILANGGVDAC